MSIHKSVCVRGAVFLCAALFAAKGENGEGSDPSRAQSPVLKVELKTVGLVGREPVRFACAKFGTNEFAFLMPSGFRLSTSSPDRIVLVNGDYSCFLSFGVTSAIAVDTTELQPDTYRERLLGRYLDAKIVAESSRVVANHVGPAFNMQWKNSGGALQTGVTVFIPSSAGVLEFSLVAAQNKFSDGEYALNTMLLSFRSNEAGAIEFVPPPGNT